MKIRFADLRQVIIGHNNKSKFLIDLYYTYTDFDDKIGYGYTGYGSWVRTYTVSSNLKVLSKTKFLEQTTKRKLFGNFNSTKSYEVFICK